MNFLAYIPLATLEDGSCTTPSIPSIPGCTDRFAEYDAQAYLDDDSYTYLMGCRPEAAVTYHWESYPVVTIGTQCWFKKYLNTALCRTGEAMLLLEDSVG